MRPITDSPRSHRGRALAAAAGLALLATLAVVGLLSGPAPTRAPMGSRASVATTASTGSARVGDDPAARPPDGYRPLDVVRRARPLPVAVLAGAVVLVAWTLRFGRVP